MTRACTTLTNIYHTVLTAFSNIQGLSPFAAINMMPHPPPPGPMWGVHRGRRILIAAISPERDICLTTSAHAHNPWSQIWDLIAKVDLWEGKLNIKEVKSPPFPLYVLGGGCGFILISVLVFRISAPLIVAIQKWK